MRAEIVQSSRGNDRHIANRQSYLPKLPNQLPFSEGHLMAIFPIQGATGLLKTLPLVGAASGAVSDTSSAFANLLAKSLSPGTANEELGSETAKTESPTSASPSTSVSPKSPDDVDALRQQTAAEVAAFADQFRQLLEQQGIDITSGIHLQLDAQGSLRVAGDHNDQEQIDQLLQTHPELADGFRSIAARASLLKSMGADVESQFIQFPSTGIVGAPDAFATTATSKLDLLIAETGAKASFVAV